MSFLENNFFLLAITFGIFFFAKLLQKKTGLVLLNPILLTIALLIIFLKMTNISYETYNKGGHLIEFWLRPAVVALGVPLYLQLEMIKKQLLPILLSQLAGCIVGVISVVLIAKFMGASQEVILSLAPKSVTTPIAMEVTKAIGGIPSLTAAVVVAVGLLGAICGFKTMKIMRVGSPIAQGLSMGNSRSCRRNLHCNGYQQQIWSIRQPGTDAKWNIHCTANTYYPSIIRYFVKTKSLDFPLYKELNAKSNLMIPFKDVTLADRDTITSFTMKSDRRNCDLSFSNLCSWRFLYDTQFAVVDNFLVFKFWAGEQLAYMMPVGTGDLKAVLWELIEDARKENQHFCMLGVCSNMRADLEAILPGQFTFTEDRDYADYIYLRSDLSTLKGKKFQAKRNHINRFRNTYPDYEYTPITPDRIQECLDLEAEWCKVNHCDQQEGTGNERRALIYALHNFDALGLTGGILHVNSKIVAFTFGMPINHETFGVHVEKADTNIEGAYAMINYEFANRIPEQYIYINREEDLGLEGLRKAKLSYQPVTILEKYMACLKEHPMNMVKW